MYGVIIYNDNFWEKVIVQLVPNLKSSARMFIVITIMSEPQAEKIQMVPHGLN